MKKGDKIVGIVLLIIVALSLSITSIYKLVAKGTENIAVVKREGTILKTIDLKKIKGAEEFVIKTEDGHYNTILVNENGISIKDADCPNQECVKSGWIKEPGRMIVCLPFRLIISIEGESNSGVDSGPL